jgi:hypothetical protein
MSDSQSQIADSKAALLEYLCEIKALARENAELKIELAKLEAEDELD